MKIKLSLNPTTSFLIPKALWRRRNESLIAPAITGTPSGYVPCGITRHARDPRSAHNVLQGRTLTRCRVSCVWHETDFKEETSKTVKRSGIFFFESNSCMLKKENKKKHSDKNHKIWISIGSPSKSIKTKTKGSHTRRSQRGALALGVYASSWQNGRNKRPS